MRGFVLPPWRHFILATQYDFGESERKSAIAAAMPKLEFLIKTKS